jgi:hypothetical protein
VVFESSAVRVFESRRLRKIFGPKRGRCQRRGKNLVGIPEEKRPLARPRQYTIKMTLQGIL